MLIPQILPDEFLLGYQARLRILNGFPNNESLMKALLPNDRRSVGTKTGSTVITALANLLGTDCPELVCRHSMIPFIRAIARDDPDQAHGAPDSTRRLVRSGLRAIRRAAHFCPACVAEDMDFRGIPYWRRSHQIPGLDWCPKHGQALLPAERNLFEALPPAFSWRMEDSGYPEKIEHPVTRRYGEIALGLIDLKRPINASDAGRILGNAARAMGLRLSPNGRRALPSDLAKEQLPTTWLERHFPRVANKLPYDYIKSFDGVCLTKGSAFATGAYALVAALIYPSADEALFALTHPECCPPQKAVPLRSTLIQDSRRTRQLTNAYVDSDGIPGVAARILNAEPKNIRMRLCELGLPSLKGLDGEARSPLLAFLQGAPIEQVCSARELDATGLMSLVRAACLPLRSALEAMESKGPRTKPSVH
jgi:hypothetical protein